MTVHFAVKGRVLVEAHLLNSPFKDRTARRLKRNEALSAIYTDYLKAYLPEEFSFSGVPEGCSEERMFSMWLQGEDKAPALVKACLSSLRKYAGCPVEVLDEGSISNWADIPGYVWDRYRQGKMRAAHFSDICRVQLLRQHGGIWADSTCLLHSAIPEDIASAPLFMFRAEKDSRFGFTEFQNFFIVSAPSHPLLEAWADMMLRYWKAEKAPVSYFVHQMLLCTLIKSFPDAGKLFDAMPSLPMGPVHRIQDVQDQPFSKELLEQCRQGTFLQKLNYKKDIVPGSMADNLIEL
ncbi:MAG: hypothetical protein J6Y31_01715 [Bacteroidales bacterium]|nr:hypothetical protein [Bacteroidales bacterium]